MSAMARQHGWRGFENAGAVERVEKGAFGSPPERGGWWYRCDGMPTMMGCGADVVVPRRWTRVGMKKGSGWLVTYGLEAKDGSKPFDAPGNLIEDTDVVLVYCPRCAAVVKEQMKKWSVA